MPASYQELKARIRKRTRIVLRSLLFIGICLIILYGVKLWTEAKSRAEFYAGLNLSVITDTSLPASERLQVVFGAAAAAQQYPDGLIATALFQLEQFENSLLRELQRRTPHDSLPGMVFIPAGDFLFGGFGKYHGTPKDTSLAAFYIDQYPVTNF
ncbi:formylglycine-generating enzyme family protein, partial [candidate division KSB1 bacterium]|nr:formylglycine-generating enzyme family protein [candidate division KSB1 bacterium]